jgi:6-phosphogluconolactonase (cycloisomerase 2 family)
MDRASHYVRTSIDFGGLRRLTAFGLGAILATSGCGSGPDGSAVKQNNQNNQTHYPDNATGFAYVASAGPTPGSAGAVYEYAVGGDGTLSPLAQPSIAAGLNPSVLVVAGNGGHVYVVNAGDGTISQYAVADDATLKPLSPATVTNPGMHTFGSTGGAATVDLIGGYLYVANTADDNVAQFSIGSGGQLTSLTPATVETGVAPVSVIAGATSSGVYYILNSGAAGVAGSVSQYTQATDGTLTPTNDAPVTAGTNPSVLALGVLQNFVYAISNCDGTQCLGSIRQFSVGTNGALTDTGNIVTTGSHSFGVGMVLQNDPAGSSGYVLSNAMGVDTETGTLSSFQIGNSGALVATNPPTQTTPGLAVALTQPPPTGDLYVLTTNTGAYAGMPATGGSVFSFAEGNGGAPTLVGTTTLSVPNPTAMGVWVLLAP